MDGLDSPMPVVALGNGALYRAIVSLPERMAESNRHLQERIVFFEASRLTDPCSRLEKLLALAWCINTEGWCEQGCIYDIETAEDLLGSSYAAVDTGELRLLEIGAGGDEAIGPDQVHYARAPEVDLFVTPRVATRLQELLTTVEAMYIAGPVVRVAQGARRAG